MGGGGESIEQGISIVPTIGKVNVTSVVLS